MANKWLLFDAGDQGDTQTIEPSVGPAIKPLFTCEQDALIAALMPKRGANDPLLTSLRAANHVAAECR